MCVLNQVSIEIDKNFIAFAETIEDKQKSSHFVLTLVKNDRKFQIWKESVFALINGVFDYLTPTAYQMFASTPKKRAVEETYFDESQDFDVEAGGFLQPIRKPNMPDFNGEKMEFFQAKKKAKK